jgi:hypothetical protein
MSETRAFKKAVFVDTNVAMHFLRLDQIDWIAVAGAQNVELIICAVFLRELDKHKSEHTNKKLRKRAGEYTSWLLRASENPLIRDRVALRFVTDEPMLDFKANGLDAGTPDDRLVAAVIEFSNAEPQLAISVVTADIGLTFKFRNRKIAVFAPPESARLPDEPSDEELEIRDLRKQLSTYANRVPKPVLTFANGESVLLIEKPTAISEAEYIAPRMEKARKKFPYIASAELPDLGKHPLATQLSTTISTLTVSRDRAFNLDVDRYLAEYRDYLKDCYHYARRLAALNKLDLRISNVDGTATATKIDIFLTCNGKAVLSDSDEVGTRPVAPEPPVKRDVFYGTSINPAIYSLPRIRTLDDVLRDSDPTRDRLDIEAGTASFYVHQVKHRQYKDLLLLWLDYDDIDKLCSTTLNYEIHADELPNPLTGSLHVKIK